MKKKRAIIAEEAAGTFGTHGRRRNTHRRAVNSDDDEGAVAKELPPEDKALRTDAAEERSLWQPGADMGDIHRQLADEDDAEADDLDDTAQEVFDVVGHNEEEEDDDGGPPGRGLGSTPRVRAAKGPRAPPDIEAPHEEDDETHAAGATVPKHILQKNVLKILDSDDDDAEEAADEPVAPKSHH